MNYTVPAKGFADIRKMVSVLFFSPMV